MKEISPNIITKMSNLLIVAADETRLKILCSLLEGEKCVTQLIAETECTQSLISHQLQVLKKSKLVSFRKDKNFIFYSLNDEHVHDLIKVAYDHVNEGKK